MKNNTERNQRTSEERKVRKPIMEKKRRARINDSLENLKKILLECDPETCMGKHGQRSRKLEKADILELTVKYLQNLKVMVQQNPNCNFIPSTSNVWVNRTNLSTHIQVPVNSVGNGQVFCGAPRQFYQQNCVQTEDIWRPW